MCHQFWLCSISFSSAPFFCHGSCSVMLSSFLLQKSAKACLPLVPSSVKSLSTKPSAQFPCLIKHTTFLEAISLFFSKVGGTLPLHPHAAVRMFFSVCVSLCWDGIENLIAERRINKMIHIFTNHIWGKVIKMGHGCYQEVWYVFAEGIGSRVTGTWTSHEGSIFALFSQYIWPRETLLCVHERNTTAKFNTILNFSRPKP